MINLAKILSLLEKNYPSRIALLYRNKMQLLVATILSAQCTDARVNLVTQTLFKKYKTARDFAKASRATFEQEIRSTGFYKNKAKNIIAAAKMIVNDFNGKVPDTMEDLIKLPGVARKTANVVLTAGFGKTEGIVVDTHVIRLSQRLGFSKNKNPEKIEQDLMQIIPREKWGDFSLQLILHGRKMCKAKKPLCYECFLKNECPYKPKTKEPEVKNETES